MMTYQFVFVAVSPSRTSRWSSGDSGSSTSRSRSALGVWLTLHVRWLSGSGGTNHHFTVKVGENEVRRLPRINQRSTTGKDHVGAFNDISVDMSGVRESILGMRCSILPVSPSALRARVDLAPDQQKRLLKDL